MGLNNLILNASERFFGNRLTKIARKVSDTGLNIARKVSDTGQNISKKGYDSFERTLGKQPKPQFPLEELRHYRQYGGKMDYAVGLNQKPDALSAEEREKLMEILSLAG